MRVHRQQKQVTDVPCPSNSAAKIPLAAAIPASTFGVRPRHRHCRYRRKGRGQWTRSARTTGAAGASAAGTSKVAAAGHYGKGGTERAALLASTEVNQRFTRAYGGRVCEIPAMRHQAG